MHYNYKARTKEGKTRTGTIEASSREAALAILEKYQIHTTSLKEAKKIGIFGKKISLSRISVKDVVIFTRQFSIMLKSAIAPVEALRAQVNQTENSDFREKILKMAEMIEGGSTLSQAFSLFPKIFSSFYISIIKSGETTGKMADSLVYLAEHIERDYNLSRKIKGAMIYPIFVIIVFIGVFFLATFFIVPNLTKILQEFGGKLPVMTEALIAMTNFTRKGGWILIALFLVVLFGIPTYLKKNKSTENFYYKMILKIPILGDFQKKIQLTKIAENLSVLISSGLPITQALKIVEEIITNSVYKDIIKETADKVARGEKISSVFFQYPKQIPSFVYQMVSTGEETGRLDEILMNVVDFYQQEIEATTDNLTSILEPFLILFLGIGVAILTISIFLPLFQVGLGGMGM